MNWKSSILPQSFYDRNPEEVAKDLLGKFLVRKMNNKFLVGMIVETEAYLSADDAAAHAFKGKTKRNQSLYKEAGHTYVHSMRQYHLLDLVTEGADTPSSVLIRAIKPIEGMGDVLTDGPGKLCRALGIDKKLDGINVTDPTSELFVVRGDDKNSYKIKSSSRIGISKATDLQLRFHLDS